jgi:hypothetical protein
MLLSSLVLSLGCFVGCNSDETPAPGAGTTKPTETTKPPAAKPDDVKK